jgi:hypothetical protein
VVETAKREYRHVLFIIELWHFFPAKLWQARKGMAKKLVSTTSARVYKSYERRIRPLRKRVMTPTVVTVKQTTN